MCQWARCSSWGIVFHPTLRSTQIYTGLEVTVTTGCIISAVTQSNSSSCGDCGLLCLSFRKNVSVDRQSSERSKQQQQQNRRHVDHERDGDHSSRDSDYDQRSTCARQLVCFTGFFLCTFNACFLVMIHFRCRK